ncbi:MAG TPA: Ig-like domain-containing protein [Geobacteraceae bacterium]
MYRVFCLGIAILLLMSGCSESPTRHNDFTPLTSIEIQGASSIAANTSTVLTVTGDFSGQFKHDVTNQAVWSSDTPSVANFVTAGSPNRVTGLAPGTAVLTATVGGISATFNLTVTSATVTTVTITPAAPTIAAGLTTQFTANGTFSDGTTQDLTFDATWSSSAPSIATVGNVAGSKGLAQALAAGTTTITATFGGVSGSTLLTVTEVVLQSITVSPVNPSILSVSTSQFAATGHYSDGSTADITNRVAWNSSQTGIATISASGLATTLVPGTTAITASLSGVSGASNLKVTGGALTGITLLPVNPRLVAGTVGTITATGSFNNGTSREITGTVGWSVANTNIATITTPGGNVALMNALLASATPTRITATFGTVNANTNLTVAGPLLQSIAISPSSLDLAVGTSGRLTATATFSDSTTQDVTASVNWTSSVPSTVSVDNTPALAKGRVHGIAATGPVIITATFGGRIDTAQAAARTRTLVLLTVSNFPAITMASGSQVNFTATATYSDATTQSVTEDTIWTIGNGNVAILADSQNQPGRVVAVDSGSTTLTASFGGKTQSVTITVP